MTSFCKDVKHFTFCYRIRWKEGFSCANVRHW